MTTPIHGSPAFQRAAALFALLALLTSPGRAQTDELAAGTGARVTFKTGHVPMRIMGGGTATVQFDLSGEIGGRVSGRIVVERNDGAARAIRTEYVVSGGTIRRNETDWEFAMQLVSSNGQRSTSKLTMRPPGRARGRASPNAGIEHEDSWSTQAMADGDVWVIDGLTCQRSGTDLVCL